MLVLVSIIATGSLGGAHAQESGMSITATAQDGSDTITLTGHTVSTANNVAILVQSPLKNVIYVDQIDPGADGMFSIDIKISEILWKEDGIYTITAQQGDSSLYNLSVKVQVIDGTATSTDTTQSTFENTMIGTSGNVAEMSGLTLRADAMEGSDTITVIGNTDRMQTPITLKVTTPNGNVISVSQASPDADGNFSVDIMIGGSLWSQDGLYTIYAQQGDSSNYKASVQVDVLDGVVVPEFGTIAALILAVAIISIIAISARSRLSIMPKY